MRPGASSRRDTIIPISVSSRTRVAIRVEKIAAYQAQKTASELLGLDILPPVEDS